MSWVLDLSILLSVCRAHTLLMSEGDERFHIKKRFKKEKIRDPGKKSAGKGSRPPRSESDGDRTPTINFCDGLKATN